MAKKELSMEMRVLLAFALSAVVLVLYAPIHRKLMPPPAPAALEDVSPEPAPGTAGKPAPAEPAPASPATASRTRARPAAPPASALPAQTKQAGEEREMVVENDLYRVVLSNRGGVVKSWTLKQYNDEKGGPLELVNHGAAPATGYPFSLWTEEEPLRTQLNGALFQAASTGTRAPATVTFEYSDGTVSARKEFRFEHASYLAGVSSTVERGGEPVPHLQTWQGNFGDHAMPGAYYTVGLVSKLPANTDAKQIPHGDIDTEGVLGGGYTYAGIEDLYFAAIWMPPGGGPADANVATLRSFRSDVKSPDGKETRTLIGLGVAGSHGNSFRLFVGPKALDVLNRIHPQPRAEARLRAGQPVETLGTLVNFGWFAFIAKPLFLALKWVHSNVVANYGWAIVLVTVVINMILFPLKLKSMRSAMKMQKLAPQIKAIQEKYKKMKINDPRRAQQNQEVMGLYKQHGVNPVGGCFPMLLQMPFLFAFYKVLSLSIEMRHAPWVLWIRDLSSKDPYYVLPLVMVATMFVLQKMTPATTTDPAQQKMFLMMPLIFGVMFINVSSGLVLYWLVGNIVGIAQQWYINKVGLGASVARKPAMAGRATD